MPKIKESVIERFRKIVPELSKPETEYPTMPNDMSMLSEEKIADAMSNYASWQEFIDDCIIDASAESNMATEAAELRKKELFITYSGAKKTKEALYNEIDTDPSMIVLNEDALEKSMYLEMLRSKSESIQKCINVLSRDITRRKETRINNR